MSPRQRAGLDKQIRGSGSGMAARDEAIIEKPSVLCTLVGCIPGILKHQARRCRGRP